jgi:hypothetical protein
MTQRVGCDATSRRFVKGGRSDAGYRCLYWIAIVFAAAPAFVYAQTDEIQVYDANIAEMGKFNLMVHDNFTPSGRTTPAFPGAIISNRALVGVAEFAYGRSRTRTTRLPRRVRHRRPVHRCLPTPKSAAKTASETGAIDDVLTGANTFHPVPQFQRTLDPPAPSAGTGVVESRSCFVSGSTDSITR